jgi:RNA polymerase sigma factor (sigma-70 family)
MTVTDVRADPDRDAEERFRQVFVHLAALVAYARRRGSRDPEGIAADAMAIAWTRLDVVPEDDPLPWLFATARNLLFAEARRTRPVTTTIQSEQEWEATGLAPEALELDSSLVKALQELAPLDREALLLVGWEDLTPAQAATALGVSSGAFRVRLWRARRRLQAKLSSADKDRLIQHHDLNKELT